MRKTFRKARPRQRQHTSFKRRVDFIFSESSGRSFAPGSGDLPGSDFRRRTPCDDEPGCRAPSAPPKSSTPPRLPAPSSAHALRLRVRIAMRGHPAKARSQEIATLLRSRRCLAGFGADVGRVSKLAARLGRAAGRRRMALGTRGRLDVFGHRGRRIYRLQHRGGA